MVEPNPEDMFDLLDIFDFLDKVYTKPMYESKEEMNEYEMLVRCVLIPNNMTDNDLDKFVKRLEEDV